MKILAIILIGILFYGTIYPCSDIHMFDQNDSYDISLAVESNCEDNEVDDCAPLCVCECCAIPIIAGNIFAVNLMPKFAPNNVNYNSGNPNSNTNLVFQPPQTLI